MRRAALAAGLVLCPALLIADSHNVDFDSHADFSHIKSFFILDARWALKPTWLPYLFPVGDLELRVGRYTQVGIIQSFQLHFL